MNGNDDRGYPGDQDQPGDTDRYEQSGFWSEPDEPDIPEAGPGGFWSEAKRSRRPGSAGPVMLLARLAGVIAVVFAVVAVIILHSTASQRLAGNVSTPTRTATPTPSPKPSRHHMRPARHGTKHRRHARRADQRNVEPVAVVTVPSASPSPTHKVRHAPKPSASKVEVGGQVTCLSGKSVEGVWVQADVDAGFAPWQGVSISGKAFGSTSRWWWWLPKGESYSLHVGCGGTQANWGVSANTPVVSGTPNSFDCIDLPAQAGYGTCYLI